MTTEREEHYRKTEQKWQRFQIGQVINRGGNRYEVARKAIRKHYNRLAGMTFINYVLYLRALDSKENRVANVSSRGTLEFIGQSSFRWKKRGNDPKVFERWTENTLWED